MNLRGVSLAALAAGVCLAPARAQTQTSSPPPTARMGAVQKAPSQSGIDFVKQAAQGDLAEVQMGQLAQERGTSNAVRQYGAALVNDHVKSEKELKSVAEATGVPLPNKPNPQQQSMYERLSRLSGPEFDQQFVQTQIEMHRRNVAKFQGEAKGGQDPDIARFAQRTLPTLQMHLQMAQEVEQKLASPQPVQPATGAERQGTPQKKGQK